MNKQFDELFSKIGTNVAVDVRATKVVGGDDDGMAARPASAALKALEGVEGARDPKGNVTGYAAVVGKDGKVVGTPQNGPPQIGVNWNGGTYEMASGRAPRAGRGRHRREDGGEGGWPSATSRR